ncbi:TIR domain-containing protein [Ferdinandcohnia sp. SAFN-114]|uniref:TIR domain-containing protein n=1 Tax=Ferdinandcohnia sp. SAFN-114 TaxID=3387275 RepID=UPI003F7D9EC1
MKKIYNLFISHSWTYSDAYEKFINLLNSDSTFSYRNYSVPKNDPIHNARTDRELYEAIKRQISPSSVVIMLAGVYSTYSKWINKEITIAKSEFFIPKPIISVEPWASERTSKIVKDSADKIVKWNSKSIIDAIKDLS